MNEQELDYFRVLQAECRMLLDLIGMAKRSGREQDWHFHDDWEEEQWGIAIPAMALYHQAHTLLEQFEERYNRPGNR